MSKRKAIVFVFSIVLLITLGAAASAQTPTLTLERIIGDLRGKVMPNQGLSVAVADSGASYLLSNMKTVAFFDPQGQYVKTQKLELPGDVSYRSL